MKYFFFLLALGVPVEEVWAKFVHFASSFAWLLLHMAVYYTPGLYWRAGAEMKTGRPCSGAYTGPAGEKTDVSSWQRFPLTYRNIAEHHGLVSPKVCRFPSFAKVYGVAAHYALEGGLGSVHLVFAPGAVHTLPVLEDDSLYKDMIFQANNKIPQLRGGSNFAAYAYALNFAKLPGGVHVTNSFYVAVGSWAVTKADHRADDWWAQAGSAFLLALGM